MLRRSKAVVRSRLVKAIESMVCMTGMATLARRRRRSETIILAYHNIVPDHEVVYGDRSLHLSRGEFARQLDLLSQTHEVIPLDSVLDSAPDGDERPRAVITFDDATQGAVTAGIPELVARGMAATVFVAPAFVGGQPFWWDCLASEGGLSTDVRSYALQELAGSQERIREWAIGRSLNWHEVPSHQSCATEEQLHEIDVLDGITLGSHTWSHPNLSGICGVDLASELARPLDWLRSRFNSVIPWLAYPYGLLSRDALRAVEAAGYAGALRVDGGWLPPISDRIQSRLELPRLNIPSGISQPGFELRVSGLRGGSRRVPIIQ